MLCSHFIRFYKINLRKFETDCRKHFECQTLVRPMIRVYLIFFYTYKRFYLREIYHCLCVNLVSVATNCRKKKHLSGRVNCCWSAESFLVLIPAGLITIFYCVANLTEKKHVA
jgi:hypothetical protein